MHPISTDYHDWLIDWLGLSWQLRLKSLARPEYRWSPSIVDVFSCCSSSIFCVFIFFHISLLLFVLNLLLLLAMLFLSLLIYEFSPFYSTLVFYKNFETLFTDRVRNLVITKSLDTDMIVADHMNQVNLSCEAEGNPSVSFIWCSKNQKWTISCQLKICWW